MGTLSVEKQEKLEADAVKAERKAEKKAEAEAKKKEVSGLLVTRHLVTIRPDVCLLSGRQGRSLPPISPYQDPTPFPNLS